MKKITPILFIGAMIALLLLISTDTAEAQCAMCKQAAEKASQENRGVGEGLNTGIVYLMMTPYILLGGAALVFYRKKITSFFRS